MEEDGWKTKKQVLIDGFQLPTEIRRESRDS